MGGQTLRAFYTRGFWRVWVGSMLWYSARWMDLFVLQWQVLIVTDSAFQVSLVGFYRMAPMFVFGLFTGLLADRFDRRPVLLVAQLWNAVASAAIAFSKPSQSPSHESLRQRHCARAPGMPGVIRASNWGR